MNRRGLVKYLESNEEIEAKFKQRMEDMQQTVGQNLVAILPEIDQDFVDKVPKFQLFLSNPLMPASQLASKIKQNQEKKQEMKKENRFGLFDHNKSGQDLVNAFVKLELFKYKNKLEKSESFYKMPNKTTMIFGG